MFEIEFRCSNGVKYYKGTFDNLEIVLKRAYFLRKLVTPAEADLVIIDKQTGNELFVY